jgi:hypothetical protein
MLRGLEQPIVRELDILPPSLAVQIGSAQIILSPWVSSSCRQPQQTQPCRNIFPRAITIK